MLDTQLMLNKWELLSLRQNIRTDGNPDKIQGVPGRRRGEDESKRAWWQSERYRA